MTGTRLTRTTSAAAPALPNNNPEAQTCQPKEEQDHVDFLVAQTNDLKAAYDRYVAGETRDEITALELKNLTNHLLSQFDQVILSQIARLEQTNCASGNVKSVEDELLKLKILRCDAGQSPH
ncbi:hypothetical protein PDO_5057 [Rhizobium sp. PDO1-076]|uniref:hypothetical protein n=1 Tax=Rhizobium sp. PDO1-076 TaxID=1125979 RepID=UPI00024E2972|nr:hypothetical protein [Rhizobium sp. PDO1-076]EHS51772.1 hypothetical protein PDO_5057 [Rhizobium sp. PDO1-076]